jgi:hypothetical protein
MFASIVVHIIMFGVAALRIDYGRKILKYQSYSFIRRLRNGALIPQTEEVEIRGDASKLLGYHQIVSGIVTALVFCIPLRFPIFDVFALVVLWIVIDIFIYSFVLRISEKRYFHTYNHRN